MKSQRQFIRRVRCALVFLHCLIGAVLLAQTPPPKQWDKRFGGSLDDVLGSAQQTADGGYILGGYSKSGIGGDKTQASRGGHDYWIVKIDANGVKQWDKRFGGDTTDYLFSVRQTFDGGYILGGITYSGISGDKTQASRGGYDYWMIKTDANGIKQWDKRFGGTGNDYACTVQQTTDSGYILSGYSYSGIGGDKTQDNWDPSLSTSDLWIVKTDVNGMKQWDKRIGGNMSESGSRPIQTSDNGYVLMSGSGSGISGDKTQLNWDVGGGLDGWVIKIDANGAKQWDNHYGGFSSDFLNLGKQAFDGGYIFGGGTISGIGGDVTQEKRGTQDYWMIKTDVNGVKQWDARFGTNSYYYVSTLEKTLDSGYIIGGYTNSGISGDKTQTSQGGDDYWIVKTDANGVKQWDVRFGGAESDGCYSILQTSDGGYLLGGFSLSGTSSDKTEPSRGNADFWIVKLAGACTASKPTVTPGGPTTNLCPNQTITLTSSAANSYLWNTGATSQSIIVNAAGNYAVTVTDASGCKNSSDTTVVTYLGCTAPAGLKVNNIAATNARIKWNAVTCAIDYKYQYRRQGTTVWTTAQQPGISKKLTGLTPATTYQWRVLTRCNTKPNTVVSSYKTGPAFTTAASATANENTEAVSNNNLNIKVYPNPSPGNTTVEYSSTGFGKIQLMLYDAKGKIVFTRQDIAIKGSNIYRLDLSKLSAGVYNLKLINDSEQYLVKFVIAK
ncbi:MAG TPA: T9SS type A sorting domain-containing protein [Parafilimonas sp.]|nr:T9SS type A sorting domain-containing protein [Parafilimonas sp.]